MQAGALPQRILVVAGTASAPGLPTTDTANPRDAAAAVDYVAAADRAGPEAIAAAAGGANNGCRGTGGSAHSSPAEGRAPGGCLSPGWMGLCLEQLVGWGFQSQLHPHWGRTFQKQLPSCPALGLPSLHPIWMIPNSQRPISVIQVPVPLAVILDAHTLSFCEPFC